MTQAELRADISVTALSQNAAFAWQRPLAMEIYIIIAAVVYLKERNMLGMSFLR